MSHGPGRSRARFYQESLLGLPNSIGYSGSGETTQQSTNLVGSPNSYVISQVGSKAARLKDAREHS
jgi:hypothetical protein